MPTDPEDRSSVHFVFILTKGNSPSVMSAFLRRPWLTVISTRTDKKTAVDIAITNLFHKLDNNTITRDYIQNIPYLIYVDNHVRALNAILFVTQTLSHPWRIHLIRTRFLKHLGLWTSIFMGNPHELVPHRDIKRELLESLNRIIVEANSTFDKLQPQNTLIQKEMLYHDAITRNNHIEKAADAFKVILMRNPVVAAISESIHKLLQFQNKDEFVYNLAYLIIQNKYREPIDYFKYISAPMNPNGPTIDNPISVAPPDFLEPRELPTFPKNNKIQHQKEEVDR